MKRSFVVLMLFVFGVSLLACGSDELAVPTSGRSLNPGDEVQGMAAADYYADNCSGCHGVTRGGATGPALTPERLTADASVYASTIRDGRPGTVMPSWSGQLTDRDIESLVQYLALVEPEAPPTWTMADIEESHEVLVPDAELATAPTHAGNLDNLMLVTEREARSIAVIDGDTHTLLGHIEASYRAHGYTFSPTDPRWAYNLGRDGWLFKIDLYTLQPVRKVRVGVDARGVAISDDGRFVIAGNYAPATAVIVDAMTLRPVEYIETTAPNPDGEMVPSRVAIVSDVAPDLVGPYFLLALKEAGQVWRVDWSDPEFSVTKLPDVGHILHDGFLSPDNRTFYLASQANDFMAAIDVESMTVRNRIETGITPHPGSGAAWEEAGVQYGATVHAGEGKVTVWDLSDDAIVGTVDTPGPGLFVRSHHDSPYVWADAVFGDPPNSIVVFERTPPFAVVGVIEEGVRTVHPEFTADGSLVYVSDWDGDVVRVYDARTLEKVAEVTGIETPTGIFNTSRRHETLGH